MPTPEELYEEADTVRGAAAEEAGALENAAEKQQEADDARQQAREDGS